MRFAAVLALVIMAGCASADRDRCVVTSNNTVECN